MDKLMMLAEALRATTPEAAAAMLGDLLNFAVLWGWMSAIDFAGVAWAPFEALTTPVWIGVFLDDWLSALGVPAMELLQIR